MSDDRDRKKGVDANDKLERNEKAGLGEGSRSVADWQKLSSARRDLEGSDKARASFQANPQAFLGRYGIKLPAAVTSQPGPTALERELGLAAFTHEVTRQVAVVLANSDTNAVVVAVIDGAVVVSAANAANIAVNVAEGG